MNNSCFFLLFLLVLSTGLAAQTKADSLRLQIESAPEDTNRIKLLNELAYLLTQETDHALALPYIHEAKELSTKLSFVSGHIGALFNEGLVHYYDDAYAAAAGSFKAAALLNEEIGDKEAAASCWNNLGNVYHKLERNEDALAAQEKGLTLRKELGDDQAIGSSLLSIGVTHYYNQTYEKALAFYDKAIPYFERTNYQRGLAVLYNNRGLVYKKRGKLALATKEILASASIEEALGQQRGAASSYTNVANIYDDLGDFPAAQRYHEKALAIKRSINYVSGIAGSLTNLANLHQQQGQLLKAETYQREAIALKKTIKQPTSLLISLRSMGRLQLEQARPDSAYHYLLQAWELRNQSKNAREDGRLLATIAGFLEQEPHREASFPFAPQALNQALKAAKDKEEWTNVRYLLKALSNTEEKRRNYRKALDYQRDLQALNDSIYTQAQYAAVADLREQYETAQKESQIVRQQLQLTERKRTNLLLYGCLFLLSLALLGITVYFRQRQLLSRQRLLAVQEQERSVRLQSLVDGREEERRRVARDLHDGLGGLLSTIKLQFESLTEKVDQLAGLAAYQDAATLMENACDEVRRIAHHLLPDALLQLGLLDAVADLVRHHNHAAPPLVSFNIIGTPLPFSDQEQLVLYRILQELLQNIGKHAAAKRAWIQFAFDENGFSLTVEDDGCGFSPKAVTGGLGLAGIQNRAERIGTTVTIESKVGEGSFIRLANY